MTNDVGLFVSQRRTHAWKCQRGNGIIGGGQLKLSLSPLQDLFASYPVRKTKKRVMEGDPGWMDVFSVYDSAWLLVFGIKLPEEADQAWMRIERFTRPSWLDARMAITDSWPK